jgi:hypothetical protein
MAENLPFTDRTIRALQARPSNPDKLFVEACTMYLLQQGRLAYDPSRDLFWVVPPQGPPQVAVWLVGVGEEPKT